MGVSAVAVGDVNGDGKLDVVTTDFGPGPFGNGGGDGKIEVLLGNGDGTFGSPTAVMTAMSPAGLVLQDLNGDGKLDLAVADNGNLGTTSGTVSVLLGNGNGTFEAPTNYAAANPVSLVAGDFNADGKTDLAFFNTGGPTQPNDFMPFYFSVLLGNGNGTFQSPINSVPSNRVGTLAVGDFNHDGRQDLVGTTENAPMLLLGNGDGTFQSGTSLPNSSFTAPFTTVLAADFNGDGNLDVAAAGAAGNSGLGVFLGNGNGTFKSPTMNDLGGSNFYAILAAGDFNSDGKVDLAATNTRPVNNTNLGKVNVLLGNGDGSFQDRVAFDTSPLLSTSTGSQADGVAVGDFNGDGKADLVVANTTSNTIGVLLNQNRLAASLVTGVDEIVTPDINNMAPEQVVGEDATGKALFAFDVYANTNSVRVALADFNGDGVPDIVTAPGPGSTPEVRVFDGVTGWQIAGPLGSFLAYDAGFLGGVNVAVGDINGDGVSDIATGADAGGGPHVRVFDGKTGQDVQFAGHSGLVRGFYAYDVGFMGGVRVAVGDVNGDGQLDIITGAGPGGGPHVHVYDGKTLAEIPLSNRMGFDQGFMAYDPSFSGGVHVAAADVNGDGRADVIVSSDPPSGSMQVEVLSGADGTVLQAFNAYTPAGGDVRALGAAIDNDGPDDIITAPGSGTATGIQVLDGTNPSTVILSFNPYGSGNTVGLFVGAMPAG
jgi:hypothetical protein